MDLNTIGISLLGSIVAYIGYTYTQYSKSTALIERNKLLISESTGKQRSIIAKTGHASMSTELQRRRTIQTIGVEKHKFNANLGSLSGAIETYFITGICTCIICPANPDTLFDGGRANDEFCPLHGYDNVYNISYDAGNADTEVCE